MKKSFITRYLVGKPVFSSQGSYVICKFSNFQTVSLTATLVKTSLVAQLGAPKRASFVQAQKLQLQATDVIVAASKWVLLQRI